MVILTAFVLGIVCLIADYLAWSAALGHVPSDESQRWRSGAEADAPVAQHYSLIVC